MTKLSLFFAMIKPGPGLTLNPTEQRFDHSQCKT